MTRARIGPRLVVRAALPVNVTIISFHHGRLDFEVNAWTLFMQVNERRRGCM